MIDHAAVAHELAGLAADAGVDGPLAEVALLSIAHGLLAIVERFDAAASQSTAIEALPEPLHAAFRLATNGRSGS